MALAQDKRDHLMAGLLVLLAALIGGLCGLASGMHPLSLILLAAGVAAALAVEFAQRDTNRRLQVQGQPPLHDVSLADAAASLAPALVAVAYIELAHRYRWLPWA